MEEGRIVKGIGGFYYVQTNKDLLECRARGIFRNTNEKPYVGDLVEVTRNPDGSGNLEKIMTRTSLLLRPPVANATQVIAVFSWKEPKLNEILLQKVLVTGEKEGLKVVVCFNKSEFMDESNRREVEGWFSHTGYPILFVSAKEQLNLDQLRSMLAGNITLLAGPSGVGKSSLIERLLGKNLVEVGALSEKIKRGKHTTRHVELFYLGEDAYLADTPGFGNLTVQSMSPQDLEGLFPEFKPFREGCRFIGCRHQNEPDCAVKDAVGNEISPQRYAFYLQLLKEMDEAKGQ